MEVSVYTIAFAVENSSIPYRACIESWLPVADEIWIACDPQWDDPSIFTCIDSKVKVVEMVFDVARFDLHAEMAALARSKCSGKWCLFLGLDESFYGESATKTRKALWDIKTDDVQGVRVGYITPHEWVLNLYYPVWTIVRVRITRNLPNITHGTADEALFRNKDFQHWDGIFSAESVDDVEYIDSNTGKVPVLEDLMLVDIPFLDLIKTQEASIEQAEKSLSEFIYIQHNKCYSIRRLEIVHSRERPWWDRRYGRTSEFDIDAYYHSLKIPTGETFVPKEVELRL